MPKPNVTLCEKDQRSARPDIRFCWCTASFFSGLAIFQLLGTDSGRTDSKRSNYFYGKQQSAQSISVSAKELAAQIQSVIAETGAEKVNVIAHSKGGLDCRCAMQEYGAAKYVASLTTINTPHHGCAFVDDLLQKGAGRCGTMDRSKV